MLKDILGSLLVIIVIIVFIIGFVIHDTVIEIIEGVVK